MRPIRESGAFLYADDTLLPEEDEKTLQTLKGLFHAESKSGLEHNWAKTVLLRVCHPAGTKASNGDPSRNKGQCS